MLSGAVVSTIAMMIRTPHVALPPYVGNDFCQGLTFDYGQRLYIVPDNAQYGQKSSYRILRTCIKRV